jgi:hypothetical protein
MTNETAPAVGNTAPIVQYVRLGTLTVYEVSEDELRRLEEGNPAAMVLNFSLFLFGVAVTGLFTMFATSIPADRVYYSFLTVTVLAGIVGIILLILAVFRRVRTKSVAQVIRGRATQCTSSDEHIDAV